MIVVKNIYIYPLKSARGIALRHAWIESRGLLFDRRWMVVDAGGTFISQRTHPRLALVDVSIEGMSMKLAAEGHGNIFLSLYPALYPESPRRRSVVVWNDTVDALDTGVEAGEWISGVLGERCSIVFFPADAHRAVDRRYAANNEQTAFSDGYPVMVMSQPSLDDLNRRTGDPMTMERFRPNVVVEGCAPYDEDAWTSLAIGDAVLPIVKPCGRCLITTIDPRTGQNGVEPLATLSHYRTRNGKVLFGQNALVGTPGSIALGDAVAVTR